MSKTVDERVVSMQFDNSQFESNVRTSLSTLDKLKNSLNLSGASKGLENVNAAVKDVNMSGLSNAVDEVKTRFSALEIMGVTALANITNSAVNTGKQLLASLTIDQVTAGWSKYGQKTASVQTIMNATGKSIDEVNGYLDKLMWFSDETSYGFTDMTAALGQLTSAGGDIDKLIPMITGIANATAYAGKGAAEFSRSIYNLNQSYSAGHLQFMDWKSLELAGVASKELKQTFIDTAVELGKISEGEVTIANFGETLKDKWADQEVMEAAFGKFGEMTEKAYQMVQSGEVETASEAYAILAEKYDGVSITAAKAAQEAKTFGEAIDATKDAVSSGWMKTFELIFGNYEEAKVLWTDLANAMWDAFASGAEARNEMLQEWKDLGGRDALIESFWNVWEGIASVIKPIKEAFREIFPKTTAEQLVKITEKIRDFTAKLKLSDEVSARLKSTFKGLFAVIDIVATVIKTVASGIFKLLGNFKSLGSGILGATGSIGDWISGIRDSIKESNVFGRAIDTMVTFLQKAIDKFKEFTGFLKEKFVAPGFEGFLNVMSKLWDIIKLVGGKILDVAASIGKALANVFHNGDIKGIFDIVNGGIIAAILLNIKKFVSNFGSSLKDIKGLTEGVTGIRDSVTGILDSVRGCFEAYQKNLQAKTLLTIASAIAILTASILVIASIDPDKLESALSAMAVLFTELLASMAVFNKIGGQYNGALKASSLMIGMSAAILIMASALKKLADLDLDELGRGLIGVAGLMAIAVGAMAMFSKFSETSSKLFSASKRGIFSAKTKSNLVSMGVSLIAIAAAIRIFASSVKELSCISWEGLARGTAAIGVILAELAGFMELVKLIKPENMLSASVSLVVIGAAMKIFASAVSDLGSMEWESLGKAGAAITGILALAAGFALLADKAWFMKDSVISLAIMAVALQIFASICKKFGSMEWESLGKAGVAIAGILALAAGFALLGDLAVDILKTAGALAIMAVSLTLLAPALLILGHMSWESIAKGLLAIAGAFAILGVAGAALGSLVPVILSLSGAIALLGLGAVAIGAGLLLISAGIAALATALSVGATVIAAGLAVIINGLLELVPAIVKAIGRAIVALCEVIAESATSIGKAVEALILVLIEVLVDCIPPIVNGLLKLIVGVCKALVKYTPTFVNLIFDFLISILNGIASRLPELIVAVVNVMGALLRGVVDALKGLDFKTVVKATVGVGLIAAMMAALNAILPLVPGALLGVLGMGSVVTELALVLAAIGGLAQIPGLQWLISEGGNFLQAIGTAIGQFFGGIAGGIAKGVSAVLPQVGSDLSAFMTNVTPFIEGAKTIDESALNGVRSLAEMIVYLTGASILERMTSWVTGGSSLAQFGEEITAFAKYMVTYSETVKSVDASAVEASVNAAKCLSELANNLPNSGGLVSLFAGDNNIGTFGEDLIRFGKGMRAYSDEISGFNAEAITASANAAKALAEMTQCIPNQGGMVAWFTGDNSVANFAFDLVKLGSGLSQYSLAIAGFNAEAVIASANAAKALAEMTQYIPNEGGMVAWFTGDNSVANFAFDLVKLGNGLSAYSLAIAGINVEAMMASASAARALAEMTQCIPNEGGMVAWFTGENSIANFGYQLPLLGAGLLGFSNAVAGINIENVTAATSAAKALADMANCIPNEGGIVAWFTGENSVAKFGYQLPILGSGLLGFSNAVAGINVENVIAASNAAKNLAEMTQYIPNEGGVKAWFTGESGIARFSAELIMLGTGLLGFSNAVTGINVENITAASNAAKSLAEMTQYIPNEGGVKAWFSGESGVSKFSSNLPLLGYGLLGFSDSVAGINAENTTAAANAAKALAEMTQYIPNEGGIKAWFSGKSGVATFASNLPTLGDAMKGFSESLEGIEPENIAAAASAAKDLAQMTTIVPEDSSRLVSFGDNLNKFAKRLGIYFSEVSKINSETISASTKAAEAVSKFGTNVNPDKVKSAADAMIDMVKAVKQCSTIRGSDISGFVNAVKNLGKTNVDALLKAFEDGTPKMEKAGQNLISHFVDGLESKEKAITSASKGIADSCTDALKDKEDSFKTAGQNLANGFADGISENTFKAEAKAKAMAEAALKAAKEALDENSPSKEFYDIGDYAVIGFTKAFMDGIGISYGVGSDMADSATKGLREAIAKASSAIDGDLDTQPTIRPVLDLSDIKSGAGAINGLFGTRPSIGVMSNIGRISAMMNTNQNGANDDVVSAIKDLSNKIDSISGDTYNINGVTYDDGSNISEAVKSIVRAARVERRM